MHAIYPRKDSMYLNWLMYFIILCQEWFWLIREIPPMENVADLYIARSQKYQTDPKITGNSLLSSGRRPMIGSKLDICNICYSEGRVVVNMLSSLGHEVFTKYKPREVTKLSQTGKKLKGYFANSANLWFPRLPLSRQVVQSRPVLAVAWVQACKLFNLMLNRRSPKYKKKLCRGLSYKFK